MKSAVLWLLLLALPAQAQTPHIWAWWQYDPGEHTPPTQFLLTVTSPNIAEGDLPPPLPVAYAPCTGLQDVAYCAPIGCPPEGIYDFFVQADYGEEGMSDTSNVARCELRSMQVCDCSVGQAGPLPIAIPRPPPTIPEIPPVASQPVPLPPGVVLHDVVPVLRETIPALPQQTAEGLSLREVGAIPPLPIIPPLPTRGSV